MITSTAAVIDHAGSRLTLETVLVAPPKEGEVLVEIATSGLCHTDTTAFDGNNPSCVYPAILGHEGAGTVVEVGDGVTGLKAGDKVIPLYGPQCGTCKMCRSGRTNLCWAIKTTRDRGVMPDGTTRFQSTDGSVIHHFMGTSTFSNYTVVPEIALAKIRDDAPLDSICLLGCAVTTGVGAALNDVIPGDTVVVFGLGGIGTNAVQGARIAQASQIIGVDPVPKKSGLAYKYGMTDFIDPTQCDSVVDALKELTDGGVDVALECSGLIPVMRQAVDCCVPGWGKAVLLGVEPTGTELSIPPVYVRYGRTVKGSYFGGVQGRTGLPRFVDMYLDGDLDIESMITRRLPITDINKGFECMADGESGRIIVSF